MADEALSQSQVEGLLKAMESGQASPQAVPPSDDSNASNSSFKRAASPLLRRAPVTERVSPYDFKRPERVGKEQMRAMHSLHETIARNFGAVMSGMLRMMLEVKLLSVDQMTYSEFVFSLDNPSCFNVLNTNPLEGNWILDISPALSYAVIDRMLGGDPEPGNTIRRPLTEIETRLIGRVVKAFLLQLHDAWENIVALDLSINSVESNPQLVQIVPPNEVVILICFEVTLSRNRGMINLCIPFNTIERFNSQLSNNGWVGYSRTRPTPETRATIGNNVGAAGVDAVVTLARSTIRTGDLLDLAVGDLITTEKDVAQPLELSVQGIPKFTARAGAFRGKKAVRIDGMIEP
ncbi:MAG: flagellar motor switch protein FliM [Planctomycetaceae bacterium]